MNRDLFKEFGTQDCRSWQVQNLQGKPAGWRPGKQLELEFILQLELEFFPFGEPQSFSFKTFT